MSLRGSSQIHKVSILCPCFGWSLFPNQIIEEQKALHLFSREDVYFQQGIKAVFVCLASTTAFSAELAQLCTALKNPFYLLFEMILSLKICFNYSNLYDCMAAWVICTWERVPAEARRCCVPWNWTYRQLWAIWRACSVLNSGPLWGENALLIAESFLWPLFGMVLEATHCKMFISSWIRSDGTQCHSLGLFWGI